MIGGGFDKGRERFIHLMMMGIRQIALVGAAAVFLAVPSGIVGAEKAEVSVTVTEKGNKPATPPGQVRQGVVGNEIAGETLKERIKGKMELVQQNQEENRARVQETRKARIRQFFGLMEKRLEAVIARQVRLAARIESRLSKLASAGEDVSIQSAKLVAAKALTSEAETLVGELGGGLEAVLEANDPKAAFSEVKGQVKAIVDKLKESHRLMVEIITEIKGLRVGNSGVLTPKPSGVTPKPTGASPTPTGVSVTPTMTPTVTVVPTGTL